MKSNIKSSVDQRGVAVLTINHPEKRNAFDDTVIADLTEQLVKWNNNANVRVVVLTGEGDVFSSGADLVWMKSMAEFDETANYQDSLKLAELMHQLYGMDKPTVARINGDAFGGALGLLACCDIAIAVNKANFSFSEVKLGIIPAVISPFVVEAIGLRQARKLFLSGERFTANDAHRIGLIHESVDIECLDEVVEKSIKQLLSGGPVAQSEIKTLLRDFSSIDHHLKTKTAKLIAKLRTSPEGQEGISAFLEKRKAEWVD